MREMTGNRTPVTITLPWRPFKAFSQLYDAVHGAPNNGKLLVTSKSRAGANTRDPLILARLIAVRQNGDSLDVLYQRGVPYGRDVYDGDWVVRPDVTSVPGAAWMKSEGSCYFCGERLQFFSQLALGRGSDDTSDDTKVFMCKQCHAVKGPRGIEEFRFLMSMRNFQAQHGIRFEYAQVEFLRQRGIVLDIPRVEFWFERGDDSIST